MSGEVGDLDHQKALFGVVVGLLFGSAIGVATEQVVLGMGAGLGFGIALGIGLGLAD